MPLFGFHTSPWCGREGWGGGEMLLHGCVNDISVSVDAPL